MNVGKHHLFTAIVLVNAGLGMAQAPAVEPAAVNPLALTDREENAIAACLNIVRGCQLPDGAFRQLDHGPEANSLVWIAPYFGNYAALALLAGHERRKNSADHSAVGRWLEWCARNQTSQGYWNDFDGTLADYRDNGRVDAWDSSAATFLMVAGRYHCGDVALPEAIAAAARKALECIEAVTDVDGLTWATPTHKVKFLMDNIEVYAGLRAGARLFTSIGANAEVRKADDRARAIGQRLPDYWLPADNLFASALHENGTFEVGVNKLYPQGLAQLFGIAFVAAKAPAWAAVARKFLPDSGRAAVAGPERWLVAASRVGIPETNYWRAEVVKEVTTFNSQNVYVYRPAVAALSLLEGADWMPSPAGAR